MFVADTEEVATREYLTELLVAWNVAALIDDAVQRLTTLRVRVDKHELVALAHHLRVKARNNQLVRGVAPDVDNRLVDRNGLLVGMDVGTDFQCGNACP